MQARRAVLELTPEQEERLRQAREEAQRERPQIVAQFQETENAAKEPTLSGAVRRAIHSSNVPLDALAQSAGIDWRRLTEFLAGEPVSSDVLDKLAKVVGFAATENATRLLD